MTTAKLTRNQIRAHLKAVWRKGGNCNVCGSNSWNVLAEEEFGIAVPQGMKSFPIAMVVCEECGALQFFSANVIRSRNKQEQK